MNTIIIGENQSINYAFSELLRDGLTCNYSFLKPADIFQKFQGVSELNPDLILVDLSSSIRNSRDFVRRVRQQHPSAPIVALHFYKDLALINEILQAGATAYLLVNTSTTELKNAISNIFEGKTYITQEI